MITFSDGVSLTLSQYDEYLKQQNAWIDSLPEITPEDGELYDYWISLQDEVAKENGETDGDGFWSSVVLTGNRTKRCTARKAQAFWKKLGYGRFDCYVRRRYDPHTQRV